MSKAKVGGGAAAVVILAAAFLRPWEGKRTTDYLDVARIPTACYGHTGTGVKVGTKRTDAECEALLREDVAEAYGYVRKCIAYPISDKTAAAFTSLAFNAGPKAVCGSTLQKRANAGDIIGACNAMTAWKYSGGRVVQGLVNRRAAEKRLCLSGVE